MISLNARVTVSAAVTLAFFVLLTAAALDRAVRASALAAQQERLMGAIYLLMGEAEVDAAGLPEMPAEPVVPEWTRPGSGRYAWILDAGGRVLWRSASLIGGVPATEPLPPGRSAFREFRRAPAEGAGLFVQGFGVRWRSASGPVGLTFYVASARTAYLRQAAAFRRSLWARLGAASVLLVGLLAAVLRWGLRPLRRLAAELSGIEEGRSEGIAGDYPAELKGLAEAMNALLAQERARRSRYRRALGDLAHSLKTPLSVLRAGVARMPEAAGLDETIRRMDRIVEYHLQRAATAGRSSAARPVRVRPVLDRLVRALGKVHAGREVDLELEVDGACAVRVDEGDLTELLGNLLDNAFKWARSRISVAADRDGDRLRIRVSDDGPGIPAEDAARILERGVRADRSAPGHGLGLAVVRDIVEAYGGEIAVEAGDGGGARITVRLPLRPTG